MFFLLFYLLKDLATVMSDAVSTMTAVGLQEEQQEVRTE